MPRIHVCSLARMHATVRDTRAGDLVTLVKPLTSVPRPERIAADRHLVLNLSDIAEPMDGEVFPAEEHVASLIGFVGRWERRAPLVIHCYAGVSRSTAAAYVSVCALRPDRTEAEIAAAIRAASPTATPNPRLVALGDQLLNRGGRMVSAIAAIGRGETCYEGVPFALDLSGPD